MMLVRYKLICGSISVWKGCRTAELLLLKVVAAGLMGGGALVPCLGTHVSPPAPAGGDWPVAPQTSSNLLVLWSVRCESQSSQLRVIQAKEIHISPNPINDIPQHSTVCQRNEA